jgi:hypothetical protein
MWEACLRHCTFSAAMETIVASFISITRFQVSVMVDLEMRD